VAYGFNAAARSTEEEEDSSSSSASSSSDDDDDDDSPAGSYFLPFARHKSWYDGHSFASGLFPFADGKSMESSGEAVNCYYGAYLWSSVRRGGGGKGDDSDNNDDDDDEEEGGERRALFNFARLLLATEIRGIKTYWHMIAPDEETDSYHPSEIYPPLFSENLMVGNVGMTDVTASTWFGTQNLYVHMINFMPVTAITRELFGKGYVREEYSRIIEPLLYDGVEMAWRGYVVCDRAMVEPTRAWGDALGRLRSCELDSAISLSQVLYFIAATDGFVAPTGEHADADDRGDGAGDMQVLYFIAATDGFVAPTGEHADADDRGDGAGDMQVLYFIAATDGFVFPK